MFRQGKYPFVLFCCLFAVPTFFLVGLASVTNVANVQLTVTGYAQIDPAGCAPAADPTESTATGISEDGWISGSCATDAEEDIGTEHPYIRFADGTILNTKPPASLNPFIPLDADADGINDHHDVVVTYLGTDGLDHVALREINSSTSQVYVKVNPPPNDGGPDGAAVNLSRTVVGNYEDCIPVCYTTHGFSWNPNGTVQKFDFPGSVGVSTTTTTFGNDTEANGINEEGDVVGTWDDCSTGTCLTRGFIRFTDGSYLSIDVPGATSTDVWGISDFDDIVGGYEDSTFAEHGFILRDGVFTTFDVPTTDGTDTVIRSINERGWFVGTYVSAVDGDTHSFKAKVPETTCKEGTGC
jgi:hypothetical protein